ncbi:Notchless protein [Apostichopus japonicus]|uniref:Notchless protein n=1 Tax=Stichopus japonicus TaxID=307972 RepID=A0A2G8JDF4_STIJA|nr:Notchless protein [Apostichopus japonicus]
MIDGYFLLKEKEFYLYINNITYDNATITDDIGIANAFNDYFSTIGNKLGHDIVNGSDPMQFMQPGTPNTIFLSPITSEEIYKEIHSLKDGKSPGIDGISTKIWKSISHVIVPILCHIFNLVLTSGTYPDALKVAKVIPIFKEGIIPFQKITGPISLLPCINKLLERSIENV